MKRSAIFSRITTVLFILTAGSIGVAEESLDDEHTPRAAHSSSWFEDVAQLVQALSRVGGAETTRHHIVVITTTGSYSGENDEDLLLEALEMDSMIPDVMEPIIVDNTEDDDIDDPEGRHRPVTRIIIISKDYRDR